MTKLTKENSAKRDKTIIVSVGGSLIVPEEIDVPWIAKFKWIVKDYLPKGYRFVIITGGGKTARKYQSAAGDVAGLENEDLDWIGIHSTRLNAHLFRTIFRNEAYPRIIKNPTEKIDFRENVLIAAGWKPGFSTDYDAVLLAENFGVKKLVNLTNIDYVYDKDPRKYPDAKKIEEISWRDFRKIVGDRWDPGLNAPFDPIASKECERLGLEVAIMNGKNLNNFERYLNNERFRGTLIN